jgi:signal transduction histidine kinase
VNRLDSLIMNMLEFARTPHLDRRPIHWQAFYEEISNAFESGILKKRISLVRTFPENWPQSTGDASLLRQAVLNLLHNAEQAVGVGGEISLHLKTSDEQNIILEVSDNGPGINPETMGQIFQPFFTTREQGTGLGLAIARKIVEAHGGSIQAQSNPGRGSQFKIMLPCRR